MEADTQDKLLAKMKSKYRLVSLIQKRMRELVGGQPALVQGDPGDLWSIVTREVLEGKIELVVGEEAEKARKEIAARGAEGAAALPPKGAAAATEAAEKKS
jgi:DNA-directed RNA polymerase subunit K/omega